MITCRRRTLAVWLSRLFFLVLAVSSLSAEVRAQTPDNKGTDFIVAFPQNLANPVPPTLTLFLANDSATDVMFEISGPGIITATGTVPASSVVFATLSASQQVTAINAVSNRGIRVRSLNPPTAEIAVYGVSRKPAFAGGFMGLSLDVLGTAYRVVSWPGAGAQATVVGTHGQHVSHDHDAGQHHRVFRGSAAHDSVEPLRDFPPSGQRSDGDPRHL